MHLQTGPHVEFVFTLAIIMCVRLAGRPGMHSTNGRIHAQAGLCVGFQHFGNQCVCMPNFQAELAFKQQGMRKLGLVYDVFLTLVINVCVRLLGTASCY